jgi:hypothetical protein
VSRRAANLLLAAMSLLVSVGGAEVVIRLLGRTDADGNFIFRRKVLPPVRMPIASTRQKIDAYLNAGATTVVAYDPLLGWAPRPNARSQNGLYRYNSQSLRAEGAYAPVPVEGTIRIALFGDSFIHGDEVPFEHTVGYLLEQRLRAAGDTVEVLNFGVGGYGTDQALLRWRALGKTFAPHIVIQGLFIEDVQRNVNLVRPIYGPGTSLAFSKPRFVLDADRLVLVNVPPVPPERLRDLMADFQSWELARYEYFFPPDPYGHPWWLKSKAFALVDAMLRKRGAAMSSYAIADEPARVTLRIIEQFKTEAEAEGSVFLAVHLPDRREVEHSARARESLYAELLARMRERAHVIDPEALLAAYARRSSVQKLFVTAHYSAAGNELVAEALAAHLRPHLDRLAAAANRRRAQPTR